MNIKILTILLFIFMISCSGMVKNGYIQPDMQETATMTVTSNGFRYNYRQNMKVDMVYYITVKFKDMNNVVGKYLMVEFQDPKKSEKFYKYILPITKDDRNMYIKSEKLYGFKNMKTYLTKVSLVNNNKADKIIDLFDQYNRVEYIPSGWKNEM